MASNSNNSIINNHTVSITKKKNSFKDLKRTPSKTRSEVSIVLTGPMGCGKSAIFLRYFTGRFIGDYDPYFQSCNTKFESVDGVDYIVQILDTVETKERRSMESYLKSDVVVVVYSIDDISSFHEAQEYLEEFWHLSRSSSNTTSLRIVLLGNKVDKEHYREVTCREVDELITRYYLRCNMREKLMVASKSEEESASASSSSEDSNRNSISATALLDDEGEINDETDDADVLVRSCNSTNTSFHIKHMETSACEDYETIHALFRDIIQFAKQPAFMNSAGAYSTTSSNLLWPAPHSPSLSSSSLLNGGGDFVGRATIGASGRGGAGGGGGSGVGGGGGVGRFRSMMLRDPAASSKVRVQGWSHLSKSVNHSLDSTNTAHRLIVSSNRESSKTSAGETTRLNTRPPLSRTKPPRQPQMTPISSTTNVRTVAAPTSTVNSTVPIESINASSSTLVKDKDTALTATSMATATKVAAAIATNTTCNASGEVSDNGATATGQNGNMHSVVVAKKSNSRFPFFRILSKS